MSDVAFSMVRLSRSKKTVDLAPNTIREYARHGLPLYRMGKAVFFNAQELEQFIRAKSMAGVSVKVRGPVLG